MFCKVLEDVMVVWLEFILFGVKGGLGKDILKFGKLIWCRGIKWCN